MQYKYLVCFLVIFRFEYIFFGLKNKIILQTSLEKLLLIFLTLYNVMTQIGFQIIFVVFSIIKVPLLKLTFSATVLLYFFIKVKYKRKDLIIFLEYFSNKSSYSKFSIYPDLRQSWFSEINMNWKLFNNSDKLIKTMTHQRSGLIRICTIREVHKLL